MQAFVEIAVEVAQGFRDVGSEKMLVDAMTARMTLKRGAPDTIVTTNLHADAAAGERLAVLEMSSASGFSLVRGNDRNLLNQSSVPTRRLSVKLSW
jgi:hypothetical protein